MKLQEDIKCPECHNELKYEATWDETDIYTCENCLANWQTYKEKGIKVIKRYFFG